jgi:hypothetical protein
MKKTLPLLLLLLTGCAATAPKYNYQSQVNTDPSYVFGDRFGGGSVKSPARSFAVNTKDAQANKCADFAVVGTTSNHWMKVVPRTIEIKTPTGKAVAIRSHYNYSNGFINTTCTPDVITFMPKDAATYSVDVETVDKKCTLSVVQKLPNGQTEKVDGVTVVPGCVNN